MKISIYKIAAILSIFGLSSCAHQVPKYVPQRTFELCKSFEQCVDTIRIAIVDNWSRPESARNHMIVELALVIDDNYSVVGITIEKSSGVPEYDQSAVQAVRQASPFRELAGLDKAEFSAYFSSFKLMFDPEDLQR